jgi:MYXO-CTERM domain-containing protein
VLQGNVYSQTVLGGTYSGPVTVNFVGMEIDREFVPEPAAGGWAALATLAAIGGATRWRRSRSRS